MQKSKGRKTSGHLFRRKSLLITTNTHEFVHSGAVAHLLLEHQSAEQILHNIRQPRRILAVVIMYCALLLSSCFFFMWHHLHPIDDSKHGDIRIYDLAIATMALQEFILVYHIVPLYQVAVLNKLLMDFTTLYLLFQVFMVQFSFSMLVLWDPNL